MTKKTTAPTPIQSKKPTATPPATTGVKTTGKKAKTPEEIAMQQALLASIEAQLVGRTMLLQGQTLLDDGILEKEITNVVASNGLFKVTKKPIGLFIEKLQEFDKEIAGFARVEEGVQLTIPKIPGKYLIQILSWYRDVERRDHTEASNLFFWNHNNVDIPTKYTDNTDVKGVTVDGQLVIYTPRQVNTGTLSKFGNDGMVNWFRQNMALLAEWHSHNTMGAFFSGTDDANENMTQFYGVWGKVLDEKPAFVLRYVVGNTRKQVPLSYLFDIPKVKATKTTRTETTVLIEGEILGDAELIAGTINGVEPQTTAKEEVTHIEGDYQGPWPQLEYPDDWMAQHKKETYSYTPSYGGRSSSYTGGGYGRYGGYDDDYAGGYASGYYDYDLKRYVWPDDAAYDKTRAPGGANHGKKSNRQIGFHADEDDLDRNRGGKRSKKDGDGTDEDDGDVRLHNPILDLQIAFGDSSDDTEENRHQIELALQQLSEDFVDAEIAAVKNDIPGHNDLH